MTAELGARLYHQTEGNALFMVNLLEHLVEQGMVKQEGAQWTLRSPLRVVPSLPEAPQLLITKRFEWLEREAQHVLEVASVAGDVFAAATVAAGLDVPVAEVEALCATLGQQHDFLEYAGLDEWPDGTVSGCYRFRHALYRQVLAERLGGSSGCRYTAAWGNAWSRAIARRWERSQPNLPSTSSGGVRCSGLSTIGSRRGTTLCDGMPITTRSPLCGKGWRYWRRCRRAPSGPSTP